uniref:PC3-like endoprotease variant B n=1 Tax=Pristiophorus japonicus TaxID=55135 RepID=UPI00398F34DC
MLKEKITSPPILAQFDLNAATYVTMDASGTAMSAVFSQWIDSLECPVGFGSRTLSSAERKYSTGKREAIACIYACERWHIYLYGRKFTLYMDHQALTMLLARTGSGHRPIRISRWSDHFHYYNFDVQYIAGSRNHVADLLSRSTPVSNSGADLFTDDDTHATSIITQSIRNLGSCAKLETESQHDATLQHGLKKWLIQVYDLRLAGQGFPHLHSPAHDFPEVEVTEQNIAYWTYVPVLIFVELMEYPTTVQFSTDLNCIVVKKSCLFSKPIVLSHRHGTQCASEIAMEANNSFCGVGIAYNARIGGIRLLDGTVTDAMEATAFTYNNDYIDIYSCCWGPTDNGRTMDGPKRLGQKALRLGAIKGRKGKGSIFVWAAGNGGLLNDHCGADGFVNSIYTIAIGAITHSGLPAFYGEPCPALMAVTFTGAAKKILTDLPLVTATNSVKGCNSHFRGTSSAAPMVAGVLALVLEANPNLSWRDVQHLIAQTAKIPNPSQPGWHINGGNYHVHHSYGFGFIDAALMVQQALIWTPVRPQRMCSEELPLKPVIIVPAGESVKLHLTTDACEGTARTINTLEHVQAVVSITSVCRGDLSVDLISPFGTKSRLLETRRFDVSRAGLSKWTFMSVHSWGENPKGTWTLKVSDNKYKVVKCFRPYSETKAGAVLQFKLVLWGTFEADKDSSVLGMRRKSLEDNTVKQMIQ